MITSRVEFRAYLIKAMCEENRCQGEMIFTGVKNLMHPPEYRHKCSVCGVEENLTSIYPIIEYSPREA